MSATELGSSASTRTERSLWGWGRTAHSQATVTRLHEVEQVAHTLSTATRRGVGAIARGAGRSYGDAALNAGGEVLEASRANLFAVDEGAIVTPAADGRILPGVARARAIEAASSLGIEVLEQTLTVARLVAAGEAFLTGSVRGLEPVRSVDGLALAAPGEAAGKIAAQLKRRWIATGAGRWAPTS